MSKILNKESYKVNGDRLIADIKPDAITDAVAVAVPKSGAAGIIPRGQVIDETKDGFVVHAENGAVSRIVAADTEYTEDDTSAVCPTYISGSFTESALITAVSLTAADIEKFREKGIFIK